MHHTNTYLYVRIFDYSPDWGATNHYPLSDTDAFFCFRLYLSAINNKRLICPSYTDKNMQLLLEYRLLNAPTDYVHIAHVELDIR
jgi:hypothetical protein